MIHTISITDTIGEYLYLPAIIDDENSTFFQIEEYYFISGNGTIEKIMINGTTYLNISIKSNDVEIEAKRENEPENEQILLYSGQYESYVKYSGTYGYYNITKVYYSGKNESYLFSRLSIGKNEPYKEKVINFSLDEGREGWTPVIIEKHKSTILVG